MDEEVVAILKEIRDEAKETNVRLGSLEGRVLALADLTRQVRDLLSEKLDDHHMVMGHETRISVLEVRFPELPRD